MEKRKKGKNYGDYFIQKSDDGSCHCSYILIFGVMFLSLVGKYAIFIEVSISLLIITVDQSSVLVIIFLSPVFILDRPPELVSDTSMPFPFGVGIVSNQDIQSTTEFLVRSLATFHPIFTSSVIAEIGLSGVQPYNIVAIAIAPAVLVIQYILASEFIQYRVN